MQRFKRKTDSKGVGPHFFLLWEPAGQKAGQYLTRWATVLGGMILIDFVDMESETDRSLVLERLAECFAADRIKTVLHGWTKLGIMEMTRRRTGKELNL